MPFLFDSHTYELHGEDELIVGRIDFTREESARLHASCKAHGRTLTQVMTALLSLANVEAELRTAGNAGTEQFERVTSIYSKATHVFSCMNFVNMVSSPLSALRCRAHLERLVETISSK